MKLINTTLAFVSILLMATPIAAKDPLLGCSACNHEGETMCGGNGEISMLNICKKNGDKLCWYNGRIYDSCGGCKYKLGYNRDRLLTKVSM